VNAAVSRAGVAQAIAARPPLREMSERQLCSVIAWDIACLETIANTPNFLLTRGFDWDLWRFVLSDLEDARRVMDRRFPL
jgi:hypothetical protein